MTASNRLSLSLVKEVTAGTTPTTPRMRKMRITGESLSFSPEYVDPDEIRDDRMMADPTKVMHASAGGINFELTYPVDESPLSALLNSTMFSPFLNTPQRDNDGAADSVIQGLANTTDVATVSTGDAFAVGHLVRFTGFGVAGNNGLFRCTTGSATVPAFLGAGFTAESAPPANARMKVVGFQGASGDITASASGLGSTSLNFTTLGMRVGQWIKIGGTGSAFRFATEALNTWARITAITATALTLDHLPAGWTTDAGTSKTIRVFFGDQIKNGVTPQSLSIERGFLGQSVPTYIVNTGMQVNEANISITSRQKITGSFSFTGMGGSQSTTSLDASPDPVTTGQVIAANANVGRVYEAGSRLTSPNWCREITFNVNNNLRVIEAVDDASPVAVREGEFALTGQMTTYFGDNSLLAKFYAGTPTSVATRVDRNNQAMVFAVPRATYRSDGNPSASGKNTDVELVLGFQASFDAATNAHFVIDRLEYFEA